MHIKEEITPFIKTDLEKELAHDQIGKQAVEQYKAELMEWLKLQKSMVEAMRGTSANRYGWECEARIKELNYTIKHIEASNEVE